MKTFLAKVSLKRPTPTKSAPSRTPSNPTAHSTGLQPKYIVPPVPHPCPHEHIALLVTKDGLLLRPHVVGLKHPQTHLFIRWGKAVTVEEREGDANANWEESTIIYGILGILELFTASYLLAITSRSDIGYLFDTTHAVYLVKGVTAIPLSEDRARIAVNTLGSRNTALARPSLLPSANTLDSLVESSDSGNATPTPRAVKFSAENDVKILTPLATQDSFNLDSASSPPSPASSGASTPTSEESVNSSPIAKTLANRLSFWSRLSKRTTVPTTQTGEEEPLAPDEERVSLDSIIRDGKEAPAEVIESILAATAPPPKTAEEQHSELEDKIVRESIREFTKGGMYFAYNFDITRSLQHKQAIIAKSQKQNALLADLDVLEANSSPVGDKVDVLAEPHPTLPLWRRVDRRFWWNEALSKPFIDAGLHSYVLPVMQGYYQIASFHIPREPVAQEEGDSAAVDYVIVSRRSRERAGLRYQRRGVDDDAHVANFVETETIMRVEREGASNVFSYVQIRGSIPLFWTQSGYSLKPAPLLSPERTHAQNLDVVKRHFQQTVPIYGPHVCVNLAEQQGKEAAITRGYRECMEELALEDAKYTEYDFHTETKGMKYENISKLITTMERTFEHQGYLWISDNSILSEQKGIFRVNCIDCLDRTNVVQSAFARHVMNKQLGAVALLNPGVDVGRTEAEIVFNNAWANNGDAISRAYAGTSALKGDFTRTGKRDLSGMLNDGVNSLARMYTSTFSDWFHQAVIDYFLAHRNLSVFAEFLLSLQSTDPRELLRLARIRAEAVATSVERVLSEGERLLGGWTLFAPEGMNTKVGPRWEEKVLLLSARALYIISYDYTLEKVKSYTRVPLRDIIGISKGAYILSPLEEASRDPIQNAGFVVEWTSARQTGRVTSYSLRNSLDSAPSSPTPYATSFPPPSSSPNPAHAHSSSLSQASPASPATQRPPAPSRRATVTLASILGTAPAPPASETPGSETTWAAFKALPLDPAREQDRGHTDELTGASSCKEAVDIIVDTIRRACEDAGGGRVSKVGGLKVRDEFVKEGDVVSLAEAQSTTSVYAKMEYGVKRLLWLGG
ncbi:hypothetical protein PLICRDRAFT_40794 [Plicaturopsis crispa FD-325 SS-3]|nr:hypothetical protein PLICRDRAFT_40794 [Plicaturopsis crispa FD-325 SS-3]